MNKIKLKIISLINKVFAKAGFYLEKIKNNDIDDYLRLYGKESVENKRFYNISVGSYLGYGGGLYHPCWTRIDVKAPNSRRILKGYKGVYYDPKFDIDHDLLSGESLPVKDNVAELVHTRFTIASITDKLAENLFSDVYRILKSNGIFRISAPNIDLDYRAFKNNDMSFFFWSSWFESCTIEEAFLWHVNAQATPRHNDGGEICLTDAEFRTLIETKSKEDALNYCISSCSVEKQKRRRQDHINWWNPEKLERMLRNAGFNNVYISSKLQSSSHVMRNDYYFDNYDNEFVFYMEAVKD